MKLIIDIHEKDYNSVKNGHIPFCILSVFENAIPIPDNATVCDIEQIRDEIDELEVYYDNDYFSGNKDPMYKCNEVLQIIDKYKAESEDKE